MNSRTRLRKWISDHLIEMLDISFLVVAAIAVFGGYVWTRPVGTSNINDVEEKNRD